MADTSAGKVSLDLILNSKEFKSQLNKSVNDSIRSVSASTSNTIKSTFSSIGKVAAAAFSVKAVTNFTKSCLDLGSALQEVQNVVDVTFGSMSADADKFAQSAIKNFGLSEKVAKEYMGNFGTMAKQFDFTTAEALEMAKTLTGAVGDVSSFRNMTSKESYTKLKAIFTGETESLKDLGVVMTQAALDSYALANGFVKTTKQMTEQEKVSLRYKFVLDKLSDTAGDFIRTQDGWANQTRVLSLQLESFKANLGQGFIAVLTPVIKMVNLLMEKLVQLSSVFKSTMEGIFGKQDSGSISSISSEMSDLAGNTEGVGTAAENAAKKIKRSLMHFDKLNILSSNDSASSSGLSSISSSIDSSGLEETEEIVSPLMEKLKEIQSIFSQGFKDGLGNSSLIKTKEHIAGIKEQLNGIFKDQAVQGAAKSFIDSIIYNFGRVTGSLGSLGITISENITGGIEKNLEEKSPRIKDYIVKMFDITSERAELRGKFADTFADIFSVFRSDDAKSLTANILGFVEEIGMTFSLLGNRIGLDIEKTITQPIIDNKEKIKEALDEIIKAADEFMRDLNGLWTSIGDTVDKVYTEKLGPTFEKLREMYSETFGVMLDGLNENINPMLDELAQKFSTIMEEHIKPFAEQFLNSFGDIFQELQKLFEYIKPFYDWFVSSAFPMISKMTKTIYEIVLEAVGLILDVLGGLFEALSGIIQFVVGVFTGDWKSAWEGVKTTFSGIMDSITGIFDGVCDIIGGTFKGLWDIVKTHINNIIDGINLLTGKLSGAKIGNLELGIDIPKIPHLAQGGYVRANTPQLAMIGDNRTQGEIVAPEGKIREQVVIAMQPLLTAIQQLIAIMQSGGTIGSGEIVIPISFGNELIDTYIINLQNRQVIRTGGR